MIELRTERLLLREWRDSDLDPWAALNADPRVMEYFPKALTREESDNMAARIRARAANASFGLWAVEIPGVAPFIGFVGLAEPNFAAHFMPCIEIGWRIAHQWWGFGYATEAARAVLDFGFGEIGLKEILSWTSTTNIRSRKVMERLGMTRSESDDFEHPNRPEGHPLRPHVLYRLSRNT